MQCSPLRSNSPPSGGPIAVFPSSLFKNGQDEASEIRTATETEQCLTEVLRLGKLGLKSFQPGRLLSSLSLFKEALSRLPYDPVKSSSSSSSRSGALDEAVERSLKRRRIGDNSLAVLSMSLPPVHAKDKYTDSDYDEGMQMYFPCLSLDTCDNVTYIKAVLLHNMATVHVKIRDFDAAMSCFQQCIETFTQGGRLIPCFHSVAVSSLCGTGNLYFACRHIEAASDCYMAAQEICDVDENIDRRHLATILNCLGVLQFHRCPCDIDATVTFFRRAVSIQRQQMGCRHHTLATTLNNLGRVLCISRKYEEALKAYNEAYDIRVSVLGKDHLDVAATAYNIGQTNHQMKHLDQALEYYDLFMLIASTKLGHSHQDIALTLKSIAQIYQDRCRFDVALAVYGFALRSAHGSLGQQHPEVASILNKMGNIFFEKGELDRALDAYAMGLEVEFAVLDSNHPNIAVTLCNLGLIFQRKGDFTLAVEMYKEAVRVQKAFFGPIDARVASTLSSIGHIQLLMRDYTAALESYRGVLRIRLINSVGDNLDIATTLNSVGLVLFQMGSNELALRTFAECLRIRQALLGPDHIDISIPLYNMAMIYQSNGRDDDAMQFFRAVLRIERHEGREDDASTLIALAQLYQARGDREQSQTCYVEILKRLSQDDFNDEPLMVQTLMALANLHLRYGDTAQVMVWASEAFRRRNQPGQESDDLRLSGLFLFDMSKICPAAAPAA